MQQDKQNLKDWQELCDELKLLSYFISYQFKEGIKDGSITQQDIKHALEDIPKNFNETLEKLKSMYVKIVTSVMYELKE